MSGPAATQPMTTSPVLAAPWASPPHDVVSALGATRDGLTGAAATARLSEVGPNELEPPSPVPAWRRFLHHFDDVLIYILLAAAVLKAITRDWVDFAIILAVAVANATIGFVQEGRAQNALDSLRTLLSLTAQARRDGEWRAVDAATLVPGDVVRVRAGDRVPADLRVLGASHLLLDESALTGESLPVEKDPEAVSADADLGDRSSMLFSGTIVTAGVGEAVVVVTGAGTEIGRISALVAQTDRTDTPLTRQLARLAKQLSVMIGLLAAVMLVIGRVIHDFAVDELISAAIGFAVAAVPEGLPALVTITLAMGVQQMARRRAIARRMAAVETLGSVTTICSDKTGTLTQNEMTARTVVTAQAEYGVDGTGYAPVGSVTAPDGGVADLSEHPDLAALVLAVASCNDARVERSDQGWRVVGQPTEGALGVLAAKAGLDADAGVARLAQVPFDSTIKLSATLDRLPDGTRAVHVVGAPDRMLDRSRRERSADGETAPLDREAWERRIDELSSEGLRVLAAATRTAAADEASLGVDDLGSDLTFLGVVGIVDPPRPEVLAAIREVHGAGVRVTMITGDHRGTAVAIARELGIAHADGDVDALTGADLEAMNDDELAHRVQDVDVFARTSPEHKLRIVRALQHRDEVVAMTGDGVNDAPSITRADVGVAMGIKGTEATKDAADIVLADDNFATIERAVEEGRRIYDNIRKAVVFLLPTNGAQSFVILVAVLLGLALPLSPVQILWVNLVTAVTLSLALAGEPAEPDVMLRPPRPPKEHVLTPRLIALVALASLLIGGITIGVYLAERQLTGNYAAAQTSAVTMLAFGQLAFLFSCRFLSSSSLTRRVLTGNPAVWVAAGVLVVLQLVFTYVPFMHALFDSAPIGLREWGLAVAGALVVFLLAEAGKAALRRPA